MEIKSIIKTDFIRLTEDAVVSEMIGKLKASSSRSCLIFHGDEYLGLVEKKKILRSKLDVTEAKIKKYMIKSPLLSEDSEVLDVALLMFQSNLDFVPVANESGVIGVVEGVDVARLSAGLSSIKSAKVTDAKLISPTMLSKEDTVADAMKVMHEEAINEVPVMEKGKLYGVVSYSDLLNKYLAMAPQRHISTKFSKTASTRGTEADTPYLAMLPVSSFSTTEVVSVPKSALLQKAVQLMSERNVSDVVVMDGEDYLGLLTVKNVLRYLASLKTQPTLNIQFMGLKELQLLPHQQENVQKISAIEGEKLQRDLGNECLIAVHFKMYSRQGGKHKYSVHIRLEYPGRIITGEQDDWRLETALHKVFENVKNEVNKRFRKGTSWKKPYQ